jgi:tetratricopeptide (TPR) repeat protein
VLAGVLVAQNSGQRGGGAITGAVNTQRAALATCQQASFQDPEGGVECYAGILEDAPDNVEALTYQGWALIRLDRVDEGAANLARVVEIDPDYPDARVFRAVVASRGGDYELAAEEIDRFYRSNPSPAAIQVLQTQGLEREIFIFTVGAPTRACWQRAAQAQDPAYTSVDATSTDLAPAVALAERAVAADPQDPNARLLRASLAYAQGRVDDALADLAALDSLPWPTASFLFGSPAQLRDEIDSATAASTTTAPPTSAAAPTSGPTTSVDGRIPNPGGG